MFTIVTSMDTFDYYHQSPLAHGHAHGDAHQNVDHGVPNPNDVPYGVGLSMHWQPPAPADDQTNMTIPLIDYGSGSADMYAFSAFQAQDATGLPQTDEHQLTPYHAPQQQSYTTPQVELDVLRETRRIRELELQIAEEKRRESEERRRLREAEVALAQMQIASTSALSVSRNSSPPAFDCLQPHAIVGWPGCRVRALPRPCRLVQWPGSVVYLWPFLLGPIFLALHHAGHLLSSPSFHRAIPVPLCWPPTGRLRLHR